MINAVLQLYIKGGVRVFHPRAPICGAVCPTPRVKGACASTLNKPAQKLFIKVLQNAGVRIAEFVAVIV